MKVLIIHASAGAGHRKAAEAVHKYFERIKHENSSATKIDALDYTTRVFSKSYPAVYIFLVTYLPFVWGLFFNVLNFPPLIPLVGFFRHYFNAFHGRKLIKYINDEKPDVILCLHFFSAELVSYLKFRGIYKGAVICGVTDFGVHQFWINKGTDYYFVASEVTKEELISKGISAEKIIVTGIPVEEKFSRRLDRAKTREQFGLEKDKFTVLVTSGGFGVGPIKSIVSILDSLDRDLQIAVVCGKNVPLFEYFKAQSFRKTVKPFGYVHNMDEFMDAADIIVSKSGGLTVSESLAKGLPMIIMKPIPGQETRNAEIIEQNKIGMQLLEVKDISLMIERLLCDDQKLLKEMKGNAEKLAKPQAAEHICRWIITNFAQKKS